MMAKTSTMPSIAFSIEGRPFYGNINANLQFRHVEFRISGV
ncbi:MAG: hypothetical protein NUV63_11455 [Gallionella sp.]|nr:hypothetical protein [Gallionella sp.]